MINHYYDLCTDFYEWGWGQSFHFANRYRGENFYSSIARSEHWLALQMGLKPGMKVLDVGCMFLYYHLNYYYYYYYFIYLLVFLSY